MRMIARNDEPQRLPDEEGECPNCYVVETVRLEMPDGTQITFCPQCGITNGKARLSNNDIKQLLDIASAALLENAGACACPACGGKAVLEDECMDPNEFCEIHWYIGCEECSFRVESVYVDSSEYDIPSDDTVATLIERWNYRGRK